jgi:hypothetical protein
MKVTKWWRVCLFVFFKPYFNTVIIFKELESQLSTSRTAPINAGALFQCCAFKCQQPYIHVNHLHLHVQSFYTYTNPVAVYKFIYLFILFLHL